MLAIKNNLMSMNSARHLGASYDKLGKSVERLSSGLRINSAKDDAAGLAVRELIRADVATLQQGARNARDGVSMLQAAEGALGEIDAILVRMRELCEQAATDTYSPTQKSLMQAEFDELAKECTRIAETTDFNDINLLNDTSGSVVIGLGGGVADSSKCLTVGKTDLTAVSLGLQGQKEINTFDGTDVPTITDGTDTYFTNTDTNDQTVTISFAGTDFDISMTSGEDLSLDDLISDLNTQADAAQSGWTVASKNSDNELVLTSYDNGDYSTTIDMSAAADVTFEGGGTVATGEVSETQSGGADPDITAGDDVAMGLVETAIETKDEFRAGLGYYMNRLEYASSVLDVQAENLMAAESRISDVDVATEMSMMTRNQVLAQAGISMLAQANSMPQMALQLLS
jgi:flagellin